MNTSRVMSSLSGRSHMILYAVRDTMYIYLSMITFKASRLPRTTSRIKDASLACPILICPFIKFIQEALFKNNSEHAPPTAKSKTQLSFQSAPRFCAEGSCRGSMPRHTLFCRIPCVVDGKLPVCSGSVQRHTLSRGKTCIATAGYRKSSGTMPRHTLFRMIPCIAKGILLTTHKKTTAAPQKKSARIGND